MTGRRILHRALGAVLLATVAGAGTPVAGAQAPTPGRLTGRLLVATPEMPDPRFLRTVIYVIRHDATGAMGLVLNRPDGEMPLARVLQELGLGTEEVKGSVRIHLGGPVDLARGFVLHTDDYRQKETVPIEPGVALSWEKEIFRAIAGGAGPRRYRFVLGYAGWAPGQLEAEMQTGHWIAVPADEALVFDDDYDGKWERAMARRTINL